MHCHRGIRWSFGGLLWDHFIDERRKLHSSFVDVCSERSSHCATVRCNQGWRGRLIYSIISVISLKFSDILANIPQIGALDLPAKIPDVNNLIQQGQQLPLTTLLAAAGAVVALAAVFLAKSSSPKTVTMTPAAGFKVKKKTINYTKSVCTFSGT